ncbi:MAG TPA: hypothetical protein ENJ53_09625, partial [Phaeodactylibacter sp.]|nr:hypothetical protein [Phaeodactylibacter sp.]
MNKHLNILYLFFIVLAIPISAQDSFDDFHNNTFTSLYSSTLACNITVDAGNDIVICDGELPVQLNGSYVGNAVSFSWSPSANLDDIFILNPMANVTGIYTLTVEAIDDANLVTNGDFEQGDVSFTTDYMTGNANVGNYLIADTPQDYYNLFSDCADHTSGTGNMMIVDGDVVPNQNIWCQTITVTPNTDYYFSVWATMVGGTNPPEIFFTIDGNTIGDTTTIPLTNCDWTEIAQLWNSQAASSVEICILNNNISPFGNDFALDDIFLGTVCEVSDEVNVSILEANAVATDATIPCVGDCITLDGTGSTSGANVSFEWTAITGGVLQNANTSIATVCDTGTYQLKIINIDAANNVTCEDSIMVTVDLGLENPRTPSFAGLDTLCEGDTTFYNITSTDINTSSYQWIVTGGTIVNGQGTTILEVNWTGNAAGTVCVFAQNNCAESDTVCLDMVIASPPSIPTVTGVANICSHPIANYSISPSPNISTYLWTVPTGAVVQSGQGTDMVTVDWGAVQGGDVCVEIGNDCGTVSDCFTVVFGNIQGTINSFDPLCEGDSNGYITITPSGGTAPYSFLWNNTFTTDSIGGLSAGVYTVTISDDDGCSAEETIILNDPSVLMLSFNPTNITCNAACDATAQANVSGGTSPYTYVWSDNLGTSDNVSNLCEGTYTVTATDAHGCTIENVITLLNPPAISATIASDTTICLGEQADIQFNFTGIGPFDVQLSDGTSQTGLMDGDIIAVSPSTTTIFSITNITDQGQPTCVANSNSTIEVTVSLPPSLPVISGNDSLCVGDMETYCM